MVMTNPVGGGTKTVLSHFTPTRSPLFTIAIAGSVAVLSTVEQSALLFALPLFVILGLTIPLAFRLDSVAEDTESADDDETRTVRLTQQIEQTRDAQETANLARALGMAGPLLALVFAIWTYDHQQLTVYFVLPYIICLAQLVLFAGMLLTGRLSVMTGRAQVQLALLASCFLLAAALATNLAAAKTPTEIASAAAGPLGSIHQVDAVMIGFYLLWAVCMTCWGLELRRDWRQAAH